MGSVLPKQGRILIVQDVSGVGRCSALVALPVLSLSTLSCALLPTALFSAHTGGFGAVYRRDLSEDMRQTLLHWKRLDLRFDAVYVGYVGNADQLDLIMEALDDIMKPDAKLYVDPVMGDQGRRYAFCREDLILKFRQICAKADLIFPNRTEAAMLLDQPLTEGTEPPVPEPENLLGLGAKAVVLTGVMEGIDRIGVMAGDEGNPPFSTFRKRYQGAYPGTGDLLASSIIAALYRGASLERACDIACDFIDEALHYATFLKEELRFGLPFEFALPGLLHAFEGIASIPKKEE